MKPKLEKISPMKGFKRLFGPTALVNFAKGIAKLLIVGLVGFLIIWPKHETLAADIMAKQREDARKAWSGSGEAATEEVWFDLRDQNGATEFLGYDTTMAEGQIQAIIVDGKPVETLPVGTAAQIVTNQTPFYGESGGQAGDIGILFTGGGASFIVTDTQKKLGDLHVHIGTLQKGTLNVADVVEMHALTGLHTACSK